MYVFCSSGAEPRYRQDILRAMAIPKGAHLTFRYRMRHIHPAVRAVIEAGTASCQGIKSLIVYVDQADNLQQTKIVPCRMGVTRRVERRGDIIGITFELTDFAYAPSLDALRQALEMPVAGDIPRRLPDGSTTGSYWFQLQDAALDNHLQVSAEPGGKEWQNIVDQLAERSDFLEEACFYTIRGICPADGGPSILAKQGVFELQPGSAYEINLFHYLSTRDPVGAMIQVAGNATSAVTFTDSTSVLVDSAYSPHHVGMLTGRAYGSVSCVLSVSRKYPLSDPIWDFDLKLRVQPAWQSIVCASVLVGLILAAPKLLDALGRPAPQAGTSYLVDPWFLFLVNWIFSALAAGVAIYKLPRPT